MAPRARPHRTRTLAEREKKALTRATTPRRNSNDTYELARLMFLSQHTVQDHLKSIFGKTHGAQPTHALGTSFEHLIDLRNHPIREPDHNTSELGMLR
jgi:DNA-binding CsgD family transcriptional regulator